MTRIVDRSWFSRDALEVAPLLLNCQLRVSLPAGNVAVRITEVEAYRGADDPGSHAYRGRTERTAVMFGPAGRLYVYRSYGIHWCMNVVCGTEGVASAVLLRAGEVVAGKDLALRRRPTSRRETDLAQGPARLTSAVGIDGGFDGTDLLAADSAVTLHRAASGEPAENSGSRSQRDGSRNIAISTGARVGVSGPGGDGDTYPWRFWISEEPTVSRYRPGRPRKRQQRQDIP